MNNRAQKYLFATVCIFGLIIFAINKLADTRRQQENYVNFESAEAKSDDFVVLQMSKKILQLRRQKATERKLALKEFWFIELFNILAPEVSFSFQKFSFQDILRFTFQALCPNIVRLGRIGDGGKWICNPFAVRESARPCIFYSLGLNNEVSFDVEFMNLTENKCHHFAVDKVGVASEFTIKSDIGPDNPEKPGPAQIGLGSGLPW